MLSRVELVIPGQPVPWARAQRRGKRYFTAPDQAGHAREVQFAWRLAGAPRLSDGPIRLHATFWFARPAAHYGSGRNANIVRASAPAAHYQKPDLSNLVKQIEDALNALVYTDDALINEYGTVRKRWLDAPSTERSPASPRTELVLEGVPVDVTKVRNLRQNRVASVPR